MFYFYIKSIQIFVELVGVDTDLVDFFRDLILKFYK